MEKFVNDLPRSIKPVNREFLFFHRDKEKTEENEKVVNSNNLSADVLSALNQMSSKIPELPIIVFDRRDKNIQECKNDNKNNMINNNNNNITQKNKFENLISQNSFILKPNLNTNFNANTSDTFSSIERPSHLLNLMRSRSREIAPRRSSVGMTSYDKESLNSIKSCGMINASELFSKTRTKSSSGHFENNKKFISFHDLKRCKSLKDIILQTEKNSKDVKEFLEQQLNKKTSCVSSRYSLNSQYPNESGFNQINKLSRNDNARAASIRSSTQSVNLQTSQKFINEKFYVHDHKPHYISPYTDTDNFERMLKSRGFRNHQEHKNNKTLFSYIYNHYEKLKNSVQPIDIFCTIGINTLIVITIMLIIWPLTFVVLSCWFFCKYLSLYLPNLQDICTIIDEFYLFLRDCESSLMSSITFLKYK